MAKKIHQFFLKRNLNLSKFWLVIGSIKPDFANDDINHYKDESISIFYDEFSELKTINPEKNIRTFSLKLGELYHYIADFFCHAHNNENMKENYLYHFKYEWQLNKFAYNTNKKIFNLNNIEPYIYNLSLPQLMKYKHKEYLNKKVSFQNDLVSAFEFSIFLTNKLIADTTHIKNVFNANSQLTIAK